MNRTPLVLFLVSFVLFSVLPPAEARRVSTLAIGMGEATVSLLTGSAEVLEKGKWTPLQIKDALEVGDQVRTGKGARLELVLPDKSRMRFAGDSEFRLIRMEGGGPSTPRDVKVHVALGRTWSNVTRLLGVKGNFEQSCDQAVAGVRGTVYRMDVEQDRSTLVRVYDGTIEVKGGGDTPEAASKPVGPPTRISGPTPVPGPHKVTMEEWTVIIKTMQQVRIGKDGVPEKPRDFTDEEDRDAWVDWNKVRDREI
jgi:hypothetical protein